MLATQATRSGLPVRWWWQSTNDAAGGDARAPLTARLADAGRDDVAQLTVPSDLNELTQRAGGRVLVAAVRSATAQLARRRGDRCHVTP